jgi:uncharacterized membrane protein YqiK
MLLLLLPYALAAMVLVAGLLALLLISYRAPSPGTALVLIDKAGRGRVLLDGGAVMLPGRGAAHAIDLMPHPVALAFEGEQALTLGSGARVSFTLTATLRIDGTREAVRAVFDRLGGPSAGNEDAVGELVRTELRGLLARVAEELPDASTEVVAERLGRAVPPSVAGVVVEDARIESLKIAATS